MAQLRRIFKELTYSEDAEIDSLLNSPCGDYIITSRFCTPIRLGIFQCLNDRGWLTDDLISYYIELLRENSTFYGHSTSEFYFFHPYFYQKLRDHEGKFCYENVHTWTQKVNTFSFRKIFVPMHVKGNHWALAVIEMSGKRICYIDSLKCDETFEKVGILNLWLSKEFQRIGGSIPFQDFELVTLECPQQDNGDDCGVFLITFMHLIYLNEDIKYMDKSMVHFMRRKVALSIVREILQVTVDSVLHDIMCLIKNRMD